MNIKKFRFLLLPIVIIIVLASLFLILVKNKTTLSLTNSITSPVIEPHFNHIVVIVMENKSYEDIIGNNDAPYINNLANTYGVLNNYSAIAHPSLPNYLSLVGGSTFGVSTDCTNCFQKSKNLVDSMESLGISWKAYMESMPSACFIGSTSLYAQKHNPFIYFDDIRNDKNRCNNIVPLSELSGDLSSVNNSSDFLWITPNLCNDMHNCSVYQGDKWLAQEIPQIMDSPIFKDQNTIIFITWDENSSLIGDNKVPLIMIGSKVKSVSKGNFYNHYSLLRTIEESWSLPALTNNDKNAETFTFTNK